MTNGITNKITALNYGHYHVSFDHLHSIMMTPAEVSKDELLKRRNDRIFEEMKPLVMTAYSMKSDLYASAVGAGISAVSEGAKLLVPGLDDASESGLTDSQFIENFVYKAGFYEDQIKSTYTGAELTSKLEEFHTISGQVIDDLAGKFASAIGAYFNGTQSWLTDGRPTVDAGEQAFDVNAFKSNVLGLVKQGLTALDGIKRAYSDQWADTLSTGGANNAFFIRLLDEAALSADGEPAAVGTMGYGDIRAVSQAVGAMGKGIYTNSSDMLAAYLGQEKLKSEMIVNRIPMSDTVRRAFTEATDRNIHEKITSFRETWGSQEDGSGSKTIYNAFAGISDTDADNFRSGYASSLKKLYDALTGRPDTMESPKINQINMARGSLAILTDSWNGFLTSIGEPDARYYVSSLSGNVVDVAL